MPDLRETLQDLARLEPERFCEGDLTYDVQLAGYTYRLLFLLNGPNIAYREAILAAALMELCDLKGWGLILENIFVSQGYAVDIYPTRDADTDREALAHGRADTPTEPFVLTLAKAVVQALEATP